MRIYAIANTIKDHIYGFQYFYIFPVIAIAKQIEARMSENLGYYLYIGWLNWLLIIKLKEK